MEKVQVVVGEVGKAVKCRVGILVEAVKGCMEGFVEQCAG